MKTRHAKTRATLALACIASTLSLNACSNATRAVAVVPDDGTPETAGAADAVGPIAAALDDGRRTLSPFVEAYVEYGGPDARWAGPRAMTFHIQAENLTFGELAMNPTLVALDAAEVPDADGRIALSGQVARAQLNYLAAAIEDDRLPAPGGCAFPVRARLIRADRSVLEKQGCRARFGWTAVASQAVDRVLADAFRSDGPTPVDEPELAPERRVSSVSAASSVPEVTEVTDASSVASVLRSPAAE